MNDNLYNFLCSAVQDPNRILLVTENGRAWTWHATLDLAGRIATVLRQAGARPGDRIAVQVDKSAEAVSLYLACLKLGTVYLPVNPAYTATEYEHILKDARPTIFVTRPSTTIKLSAPGHPQPLTQFTLDDRGGGDLMQLAAMAEFTNETAAAAKDDVAAILYTSGTTGRPKGAMITHGNLSYTADTLIDIWRVNHADVLLHALPIFHAHGLFIALNTALRAKAKFILLSRFSSEAGLNYLPESTLFMGVPTFYSLLLADSKLDRNKCGKIRLFTCGSAPLPYELFRKFVARTGHRILERYGLTETTIIASNPLDGDRIPGTVGYALPGIDVEFRDQTMASTSQGAVGELVVRGPNVFKGYWNSLDKTVAEHTNDVYFKTGDLAKIGADGRITIVGRDKDLIITGGHNVYPLEIEAVLNQIDMVQDSAVLGVPHPDSGEGVIAFIETRRGHECPSFQELIALISSDLARYKHPKAILYLEELPRTALGKVQKNILRNAYQSYFNKVPRP